jgi:hypothetical protein
MMEQNPARPARKVAIADHLWESFEEMAQQMGSDREALINQAMFVFARLNGFLEAQGAAQAAAHVAPVRSAAAKPGPPVLAPVGRDSVPPPVAAPRREEKPAARLDDDPVRREVAERVLETAAELERLIKGKSEPRAENPLEEEPYEDELPPEDEAPEGDEPMDEEAPEEEGLQLYLMMEGGEMDRVVKDRFVIGRGKHCDFVINSGKVSREHAQIMREDDGFYIEDLGSSNGTWFNKQRIKRRKLEDGDEYYICSEKLKVVLR